MIMGRGWGGVNGGNRNIEETVCVLENSFNSTTMLSYCYYQMHPVIIMEKVTNMGMFSVTIGVANIEGNAFQRVKATVDTGAHYSLIPRSILQKAGVKPYKSEVMEMADGSLKEYPIGRALMSYDGREEVCQVVFGEDSEPLLGALALEEFGLMVDPVGRKLLPRRLRGRPF